MPRSNCSTHKVAAQVAVFSHAKRANLILADILDEYGEGSATNVRMCASQTLVRFCPDCGEAHIAGAWCCHHRLCPICQVRRSRRNAANALSVINLLRSTNRLQGVSLHLLTLTQRNVPDGDLGEELDRLLEALKRVRHTRAFRSFVVGSARNIEVTRNYDARSWHPHIHIVLMLRDGHPGMDKNEYWASAWSDLMNLDYQPQVDVRPIKDDGAVYEVSKYVSKSIELITQLPDDQRSACIYELNNATRKRMLVAYTGLWRTARQELKILNDEFSNLDESSDTDCRCGGALMHAMMIWDGAQYRVLPPLEDDRRGVLVKGRVEICAANTTRP